MPPIIFLSLQLRLFHNLFIFTNSSKVTSSNEHRKYILIEPDRTGRDQNLPPPSQDRGWSMDWCLFVVKHPPLLLRNRQQCVCCILEINMLRIHKWMKQGTAYYVLYYQTSRSSSIIIMPYKSVCMFHHNTNSVLKGLWSELSFITADSKLLLCQ